jgi:hypothetical protein
MENTIIAPESKAKARKLRVDVKSIKEQAGLLYDAPVNNIPDDAIVFFAGRMVIEMMKDKRSADLQRQAFERDYPEIPDATKSIMETLYGFFENNFDQMKATVTAIVSKHPLMEKFRDIQGFTEYRLGAIMSYMKNPERFATPNQLATWAGVSSVNNVGITLGKLKAIQDMYQEEGKEFKGYCTELQALLIGEQGLIDGMLMGRGPALRMYRECRERLEKRAMNEGSAFLYTQRMKDGQEVAPVRAIKITDEAVKKDEKTGKLKPRKPSATYKVGEWYMRDRALQSLKMWSMSNAKRRLARTVLYHIWAEWMRIKGLEEKIRMPYAIEYLGHTSFIELDEFRGKLPKEDKE